MQVSLPSFTDGVKDFRTQQKPMESRAEVTLNDVTYTLIAYLKWPRSPVVLEPHLQINVKVSGGGGSVPSTFYYRLSIYGEESIWRPIHESLCSASHYCPRKAQFMVDCNVGYFIQLASIRSTTTTLVFRGCWPRGSSTSTRAAPCE
jgi:hypothetical protein